MITELREKKNKLIEFCNTHKRVFIYGAGCFGKGYFKVLTAWGVHVDGFIITEGMRDYYSGVPIYPRNAIMGLLTPDDGIIPGFTGSDVEEFYGKNFWRPCDVLSFNHRDMLSLANEEFFSPILNNLESDFGQPNNIKVGTFPKSILVIRIDAIGDLIFITPFLRELRRGFPKSHIGLVIRGKNESLMKNCPYIDELYLYHVNLRDGELFEHCEKINEVESEVQAFVANNPSFNQYEAVFLPREILCGRNCLDDLLLAFYSGAKYRYGHMIDNEPDKHILIDRMRISFSNIVSHSIPMHESQYPLEMLKCIGIEPQERHMELWPSLIDCSVSKELLIKDSNTDDNKNGIFIALGIVASVPQRIWDIRNYEIVVESLIHRYGEKIKFVILGDENARSSAKIITDKFDCVIDLTSKTTLSQAAAVMKFCDLYIGSNTGTLHLASAMGKPSVTIYCELTDGRPTDGDAPERMGAWMVPHINLLPKPGLDGCHGVCKKKYAHCINTITPNQVSEAAIGLIDNMGDVENGLVQ